MKNNFKLLFFTILILTLFLSLSNVCAADFDNSTIEMMDDEQDLDLIENPDCANDDYSSDELGMEDSNQDLDSDSYQSDLSGDLNEYNTTNSEVNSPIHKSIAKNGDVLKATNSISLNAGAASKVYVNYNSGNDANSGTSWSKAVKTIEKALTLIDDGGVIYIADGVTHLSDSTGSEGITINKKVSIIGQSVNSVISGNKNKRIFNIGLNAEVFLSNLTLTDGDSSNGGAISIESSSETSYGKLTISDSIISNCHATSRGGAIYSNTGSVSNLNNVTFINDSSVSNGGAIVIQQKGSLSNINDCKFINNSADNRGGAVYLGSGSTCAIGNNNLFEGNKAFDRYGYGGAIHGANGIALGTGNVFINNYAEKGGSALSTLNNKEICGSFCFFINNTAIDDHSLVYGNKITVTLENCYWASNTPAFENFVYNQNTWNPNNYLILSISANDSVVSGNKIPVKVDLSKNQNNQAVDVNSLPKSIPVLFTAANGNFDSSSTNMVNGIAKTNYIAGTVGNDNITVDVYGVTSILSINVLPKIGTLFVNYTGGSDSNNGASWSKAVKTISYALDIAAEDSSIYVAGGINYLDNTDVNGLIISKNISIIGMGDNAIIDAKNAGRIFYIDGFTVNLSNLIFANANASNANAKRGGVIWARNSILNIENCKFINNTAGNSNSYGGAINLKSSTAKINGSYFDNNVALSGGAINAENNVLNILNSIFINNKILSNGHGKSINQYKNCDLTIKNSVLLDGSSSVQIANVSKALLEDNWWGNNNLNKDLSPTLNCTNGNVNSYLILETSINKKTVHVGDEVTITTSLNRNQNGNVKNNLIELPININANFGTAIPNATTINNKLSSIYNPTVPGSEVITVDVLGIKNVLSFVVKNAIPKLTIDEVSTSWSSGIYSGVANSFDIKLINNENRKIDNVIIELASNESSKVLGSFKGSVNKGTSTVSIVDNTIRQITEKTVWPDAQNNIIKFNVKLKYDGETISTVSVDKILAYNGYFNKTYSYGGHDNVVNRKYTINGDIIIATQDEEVYKDQFSRFRNETWNIKTPKNAQIVKVLLYFNYNWDTSFFPNGWTLKFNNHNILNEYVSYETDRGNLGVWGAYDYGLLVFDVTDYYKANADNSFIINKTGNCALYPSTLYVLYNLTNSNTIKDVYFSDICDVFYPLYNQNGYDDLLKFVVNFNDVDLTRLHEANWYVFSGSSSLNNNLSFNNMTIANPFAGYTPNDCRPYDYNVTNLINQNNEAWFISGTKSSTTVAYEQVLVVERNNFVPSMSVSVEDISVGDVAKIIVKLPSDASCNVTARVDGKSVSGKVQKGKVTLSVPGLTSGSKKASVKYSGDGKYLSSTKTKTFIVNKVVPSMSVSVGNISVGDVAKVIVELPSDASGNVTASVEGKSVSGKVQKGKVTLSVPDLASGTKEATVSYSGDGKYIQKSCTEIFKVNKIIKNMTVSMDSSNVETTIVQVSNLPSDASGIVTVTIAGKSNSSRVSNGKASIKIYGLTNGTQSAHIIYSDDYKYEVNPVTTGLDVNKLNVTLKINVNDINVGKKASIVVSISPSAATGTINVLIDGVDSGSSSISKGKATISVSDLTSGTKSVSVIYSGDDKYNANTASSEFTVNKVVPSMSVSVGNISVGNVAKVIVKLPSDASGNVSASVDGQSVSGKVQKGKVILSVSGLTSGSKEVAVSYSGDGKYISSSDTGVFVVSKVVPSMSVSVGNISVGNVAKVIVKLPSDASGNVTASVDGQSVSGKVQKGKVILSVSGLTSGSKEVAVSYSGDGKYISSSDTGVFVVSKVVPSMSVSVGNISVGNVAKIIVKLPSDASGNVSASVDGQSVSGKVQKGKATISVSDLTSGTKSVSVIYSGDDKYNANSAASEFTVSKVVPSMSVSVGDICVGDVAKIIVKLPSDASGNVSASVDGQSVSGKVQKGKVTLSISGLTSGSKKASVTYSGDGKYLSCNGTGVFVVSKVVPSMSVSVENISVGDLAKLIVELPSDASGNVTVNVDGKEITAAPVTNGNINISLSDLSSGNHSIEVTYSGDDKYASESAGSSITVEKKDTHIKATNFNRLATDYYAGERGANHIGYLLDQNNNPVINRIVHIKVNGKVYDVKTNKKGAFKLQINLNTAKVYAYKITFKGDDSYKASSKSIKLKVTKKSTSIKASNKVFKSRTKTKTIKITLKTVKNKYNGKTYLKKGKKITLKVKGKTYTAKTNAKGVAKFTIKLTKKGKYSATIKFSGDKTYKASSKKIKIKIK